METEVAVEIGRGALQTTLAMASPVLIVALLIGIAVGFLQSVMQIHDFTISAVPKILLILVVIAIALPWFLGFMADYSRELIQGIPSVIGGG